jgi:hypothetical protein
MGYCLESERCLPADLGVRIEGGFAEFFGCRGAISAGCEYRAQIEVGFAEIRTKSNGFSIFNERSVDLSAVFEKAAEHVVGDRQVGVVFKGGRPLDGSCELTRSHS